MEGFFFLNKKQLRPFENKSKLPFQGKESIFSIKKCLTMENNQNIYLYNTLHIIKIEIYYFDIHANHMMCHK